jgi:NAD(P)H-flavin reductase
MAYEPGQYVWIAFALKDGPEALQSLSFHPYSISSAHWRTYSISSAPGDKTYTLHIKDMGPGSWSEAVVKAAAGGAEAFKGGCRVGGPSGRFSIEPSHFERIVLVAGGIGFTPLVSLLADIVRDAAAGGKDGASRRYAMVKHVTVLWAVQSAPCLTWFTEELEAARAATGVTVDLQLFVTRAGKDDAAEGGFTAGRPDVATSLAGAAAQPWGQPPTGAALPSPGNAIRNANHG